MFMYAKRHLYLYDPKIVLVYFIIISNFYYFRSHLLVICLKIFEMDNILLWAQNFGNKMNTFINVITFI